jgi:hypothetical protein
MRQLEEKIKEINEKEAELKIKENNIGVDSKINEWRKRDIKMNEKKFKDLLTKFQKDAELLKGEL